VGAVPTAEREVRAPAAPGGLVTVPVALVPAVALCFTAEHWADLAAGATQRCSASPAPDEGGPCTMLNPL
jgi:hypothetical protein